MTKLGIILMAATVTVMVAEFFCKRTRSLPKYGWLGLAVLGIAQWLMFRGVEPVATYFTPIAWTAYLLIADAAVWAIRGRSRLRDAPFEFLRLALISIPVWLIFEIYNLRLVNWTYIGLPHWTPARWFGYGWSFATILPGILVTADLIESFGWWQRIAAPVQFSNATRRRFVFLGLALLLVPIALPRFVGAYLFALVWLGFIFLLDPILFQRGLPSLEGDLAAGRRGRLFSLLASGWVCGWLWEFWNFWAAAKWRYIFPILADKKIFEMPIPGYLGFLPFALECFVMSVFAGWVLGWQRPVLATPANRSTQNHSALASNRKGTIVSASLLVLLGVLLLPAPARGETLTLPPAAKQGIELLYSGQTAKAIAAFREVETAQPESPLGYLLEAEARWWQIYCESCEIKWNLIDTWVRPRNASDDDYFALTDKGTRLAEAQIAKGDSAVMEFYAGMGWLLRARLLGLRDDRRGTARAGVRGRAYMLRSLQLDPQMADAYAGLGLYNYFVDTLSGIAKVLRFFMGIPGGKKEEGVRQLRIAMQQGVVTRAGSRFYLAKNMRNYEGRYVESLEVMAPLIAAYPQNPIFRLVFADTQAKLGRRELALANFRAVEQMGIPDPTCAENARKVAVQARALLAADPSGKGR